MPTPWRKSAEHLVTFKRSTLSLAKPHSASEMTHGATIIASAVKYVQGKPKYYPWVIDADKFCSFCGPAELEWIQRNIDVSNYSLHSLAEWHELATQFSQELGIMPMHVYQFKDCCLGRIWTDNKGAHADKVCFARCMIKYVINFLQDNNRVLPMLLGCLVAVNKIEWLSLILYHCYNHSRLLNLPVTFKRNV